MLTIPVEKKGNNLYSLNTHALIHSEKYKYIASVSYTFTLMQAPIKIITVSKTMLTNEQHQEKTI